MSLEAALANNTAAIRDLIAVIQAGIASQPVAASAAVVAAQAVEKAKAPPPPRHRRRHACRRTDQGRDERAHCVNREEGPDAARALLKAAGATRLGDLPQEAWPAVAAQINAKLAELA